MLPSLFLSQWFFLGFECDEKYFSIEEGICIDKSVPGSIPNWFGAPIVHLGQFYMN